MQMKIILNTNTTYCEVGQVNPLRWKTMFKQDNGDFVDQSGWIKCKDFFNDTVAYFNAGVEFAIYGYKNKIKKNDDGVWMLLKHIKEPEVFAANIGVLNTQLTKDGLGLLQLINTDKQDEYLCLIPNDLWATTYHISLITMAIRLCNYGIKYEKWEDFWMPKSPCQAIDRVFSAAACQGVTKHGFKVPEGFQDYWWFAGPSHNSKVVAKDKLPGVSLTIHNNGVVNWTNYMKVAA